MRHRRSPRLYRGWWSVYVGAVIVLLAVASVVVSPPTWPSAVAALAMVAFLITIAAGAEAELRLAHTRNRALQRGLKAARRELGVTHDHYDRLVERGMRWDPTATRADGAAFALDLQRLHAMGQHVQRLTEENDG